MRVISTSAFPDERVMVSLYVPNSCGLNVTEISLPAVPSSTLTLIVLRLYTPFALLKVAVMGSARFVPDTWKVFVTEVPTLVSNDNSVGSATMTGWRATPVKLIVMGVAP